MTPDTIDAVKAEARRFLDLAESVHYGFCTDGQRRHLPSQPKETKALRRASAVCDTAAVSITSTDNVLRRMVTMNAELKITCPKCGAEILLTESLAAPMVAAVRSEMQARVDAAESTARTAKMDADIARADIERDIDFKVSEKAQEIRAQEAAKAKQFVADDFARERGIAVQARREAEQLRAKLGDAQRAQAEAERRSRELSDKEAALDLTIERGIQAGVDRARTTARAESDEANRLKLFEKDTTLQSLQTKVAELQQKLEQGSQQLQGEVQELDLQARLTAAFPQDWVGEVGKGVAGADVTQVIVAPSGAACGLILWESKRTKSWSQAWLAKLREDGRLAQADLLVLVSTALPEAVETFNLIDGVWVCSPMVALPLAAALRATLLAVHNTKQVQAGMATKSEEVYRYVTGSQFRHRVEALVEAFTMLQDDLVAEQRSTQRQWAKRQTQIERVMTSTAGMFGDLQGIAGKALPAPAGLVLESGE